MMIEWEGMGGSRPSPQPRERCSAERHNGKRMNRDVGGIDEERDARVNVIGKPGKGGRRQRDAS